MRLEHYCSSHSSVIEEIAASQISCIVNLVHRKRMREREQRQDLVAILEDGIVAALEAWDPIITPRLH